jgi:hypothetical protein
VSVKGKRFPLPETLSFSSKAVHLIFRADEGSDSISCYDCPRVQFVTIALTFHNSLDMYSLSDLG